MKEKNVLFASFLNFIIWGSGYFYLNKQVVKGFIAFIFYVLIWLTSIFLILTVAYPLIYPLIFWIIFWNFWVSIFLAYDVYRISHETKLPSLKIKKVKKVVRRSKVRARKR
jgi:hypothetical protein